MWQAAMKLARRCDDGSQAGGIDAYNVMVAANAVRREAVLHSLEPYRLAEPNTNSKFKNALDNAKHWIESRQTASTAGTWCPPRTCLIV
jgi:hypothetical protein